MHPLDDDELLLDDDELLLDDELLEEDPLDDDELLLTVTHVPPPSSKPAPKQPGKVPPLQEGVPVVQT